MCSARSPSLFSSLYSSYLYSITSLPVLHSLTLFHHIWNTVFFASDPCISASHHIPSTYCTSLQYYSTPTLYSTPTMYCMITPPSTLYPKVYCAPTIPPLLHHCSVLCSPYHMHTSSDTLPVHSTPIPMPLTVMVRV